MRWAETGHVVSTFEYGVNIFGEKFITYFPEGRDFYQPKGYFPNVGDVFVPKELAATMRGVAKDGPEYMITGPWAEKFVARANDMGWKITLDHMTETPPRWVEPLRFPHHEYEIVSLGPPQAQGIYIAIVLGVLKHLGIRSMKPGSADHLCGVPRDEILDDAYRSPVPGAAYATKTSFAAVASPTSAVRTSTAATPNGPTTCSTVTTRGAFTSNAGCTPSAAVAGSTRRDTRSRTRLLRSIAWASRSPPSCPLPHATNGQTGTLPFGRTRAPRSR